MASMTSAPMSMSIIDNSYDNNDGNTCADDDNDNLL